MGVVRAVQRVPGLASEAEELWYDPQRWPAWVDGFGHVHKLEGEWPAVGARAVWDSRPGRARARGRGGHGLRDPRRPDASRSRTRSCAAPSASPSSPGSGEVEVTLELEYELKGANVFTPLTDALFIRRSLRESLARSLLRFARERRGDLELG